MIESTTSKVQWVGPYQLRQLLENCMNADHRWPPESNGGDGGGGGYGGGGDGGYGYGDGLGGVRSRQCSDTG